mgnify:CR=1 FL=1
MWFMFSAQRDHKNVEIQKLDGCYIHDAKANDNIHRGSLLDANDNKVSLMFCFYDGKCHHNSMWLFAPVTVPYWITPLYLFQRAVIAVSVIKHQT